MTPISVWMDRIMPEPNSGCWLWMGKVDACGYGKITHQENRKVHWYMAHRLFYEHFIGPIPKGLEIDHKCNVRLCVNPAHLTPATHAENCARHRRIMPASLRTHCPAGHPYDHKNTWICKKGKRNCRRCGADRVQRQRSTRRAELQMR